MMRALLVVAMSLHAAPALAEPRTLTLAEALTTASSAQPSLRAAGAAVAGSRARVRQARAPLYPQLDASAAYGVSGGPFTGGASDPASSLGASLGASQLLWDFGGTRARVRAAEESTAADESSARQVALDVRLDVRAAFFRARAARDLVAVARDAMANEARHLTQIEAFVEVEKRPAIDLFQARTAVANAKFTLIRAGTDYEAAKAELNRAMGVETTTAYDVAGDNLPAVDGEDGDAGALLDLAARSRPDLAALAGDRRALEHTRRAHERANWPVLRALGGLDAYLWPLDEPEWGWSAGLTLSWTLFDGWLARARVEETTAALAGLTAEQEAARQRIRLELEQARLAVVAAKAEVEAAGEAHAAAKERLRLAEGRYAEGVGNAIELGDAQVELTRAAAQAVQASYDLSITRAQLLHALGSD